jgi:hypothetical protein
LVSPAWNQFGKPLLGTVDPATDAKRQGWLDDESLRHATHHVRENGIGNLEVRFPRLFAFSARRLETIFSRLVEMSVLAISKFPACPPLRGTASAGRRRRVHAVGATKNTCSSVCVVVSWHPPTEARILLDAILWQC